MDLVSCIDALFQPVPPENFDEIQEFIQQAKDEAPLELIQAMATFVQDENLPLSKRSHVAAIMTMPIKKCKESFYKQTASDELVSLVFEILIPYLTFQNLLGQTAIKTLGKYIRASRFSKCQFILQLLSTITSESTKEYIESVLHELSLCNFASESTAIMTILLDLLITHEEISQNAKAEAMKLIGFSLPCACEAIVDPETIALIGKLMDYIFPVIQENPKLASNLTEFLFYESFQALFPQFIDQIIECFSQNSEVLYCFPSCSDLVATEAQGETLINLSLQTISIGQNDQIGEDENFFDIEFDKEASQSNIIFSVFEKFPQLIPNYVPFIQEHIEENGTDAKYACAIYTFC